MLNSECEKCGGCLYRNMGEKAYRQHKEENFIKNVSRITSDFKVDEAVFISDGQRRRAKMEFALIKDELIIGFNEEKSHNLVKINQCLMLEERINKILPGIYDLMSEFCRVPIKIKNKKKKEETKYIKEGSVYILAADNGIDIVLKLALEPILEHRLLVADYVNKTPEICRFSWEIAEKNAETIVMQYAPEIYIADCAVAVPQGVFLQASKKAEIAMIEKVKEYLGETRGKIADLFCGLGTFTYPLAQLPGNEVIAVDSNEQSLAGLQQALNRNQLTNVKVLNRNLFKYPFDKADLNGITAVLMDPPRAGAHEQCREIASLPDKNKPQKIIFISCNPNTFVYDANILVTSGYKMERITLFDQFVYSKHQELVALFSINSK